MWKAIKSIFTTPETVGKLISGSMDGIDSLVLTEQERIKLWFVYLQATMPMNLSRRIIAITITGLFAINVLLVFLFAIVAGIFEWSNAARVAEVLFRSLQTVIGPIFGVVASFYFWKGVKDKQETTKQIESLDFSALTTDNK